MRTAGMQDGMQDAAEGIGRVGLVARGVVYALMGLVALGLGATGRSGEEADGQGAVRVLAEQPLGAALLVVLALGFAGYALWRFVRAATGAGEGRQRSGTTGVLKRVGDVANGLVYVALLVSTVRYLADRGPGGGNGGESGDEQARSWSARLLEASWGQSLVVVAGIAFVVAGAAMIWWGVSRKFEDHLRTGAMSGAQRRWLPRLGVAGHAARGVVAALIGFFLVHAAVGHDPQEAVGIDGALRRLAEQTHGRLALVVVALGLVAYGAYSFVEARWRRILEG